MNRGAKFFFQGLLVLLPLVVTIYLVWIVVDKLVPLFTWIGGLLGLQIASWLLAVVGVCLAVTLITLVGALASNLLGRQVVMAVEMLFERVPLVKLLYNSIKDLLGAFVGDKKSFDRPVVVSLTGDGAAKVVGFVTRDSLDFLGVEDHVAVYLPQSYNFAGNLVLFPRDQIRPIDGASGDVMSFLVSGGVSGK